MNTLTSTANTVPSQPAASLKPKEHGAYAILAIPLGTSLVIAGPTTVGICVAIASSCGFLGHEPLLVAIGHRGKRAQRTTPAALNRAVLLLSITMASGMIAFLMGTFAERLSLAGCALLAIVSFTFSILGKHKTVGGQFSGVIALSAPCIPILLAGQFTWQTTLEAWATWLLGFSATTIAVRGVIAAQKRQSRTAHWSALLILSLVAAVSRSVGFSLPIVTLPMVLISWYLMVFPPSAKQLKRVGWTLVIGTLASAIWMIVTLSTIDVPPRV